MEPPLKSNRMVHYGIINKSLRGLTTRYRDCYKKALVRAFIGGLKLEIFDDIKMFRPSFLNEAVILVCIEDKKLSN